MRKYFMKAVLGGILAVSIVGGLLARNRMAVDPEPLFPLHVTPSRYNATIAKTAASSRLRLIFFVGLEGSGHHFFREAFKGVFENHDLQQIDECRIAANIYMPSVMKGSASAYKNKRDLLRSQMQKLAALEKGIEAPGTFVTVQRTNPAQERACGKGPEYSYPNGFGPDKALAYVDFQMLARVAEEEGVDFRIVYLNRSAKAILLSDINHRHFHRTIYKKDESNPKNGEEKFLRYVEILLENAAIIHSSLSELGAGFVVCHYFDELTNAEQAWKVADFISPNEVVGGYLLDSMLEHAQKKDSSGEELPYEDAFALTERLQQKLDVIDSQHCGR